MNLFERSIAFVSPKVALRRASARSALMHYDAASRGRRGQSWHPTASDGDAAARQRDRLSFVSRDLVRNNPYAQRGVQVIANNVVGDGIIPKIEDIENKDLRKAGLRFIENFVDTVEIDGHGRQNLYGLQRLVMSGIVDSGEMLILREQTADVPPNRARRPTLRLRVLEPDFLDPLYDGQLPDGGSIHEGIEYDRDGKRVAYHLFDQHPGSDWFQGVGWRHRSRRVDASRVLHIYRQDRAGQMRGVTWLAPVAMALQDLGDYQDAQIMRQKIAACFAAFRKIDPLLPDQARADMGQTIMPGMIQDIGQADEITFADPPTVGGYDQFMKTGLMSIAAGLGVTYEAYTGDLSGVNFSSGRMGRMEMDRNVSSWQWTMLIPQMLQPLGVWLKEEWALCDPEHASEIMGARIGWVPPHRALIDPTREIPALRDKVRAGFTSRQRVIRELGDDPERVDEEIAQDRAAAIVSGLFFDTDATVPTASAGGVPPDDAVQGDDDVTEVDEEDNDDDQ